MKFPDQSKIGLSGTRFAVWVVSLILMLTSALTARGDLVEEVEDLDRQPRQEQPTSAPASESPSPPRPTQAEPGPPAPRSQDKSKPRSGRKKAVRSPVQFESKTLQALKDQSRVMLKDDVIITQGDFRLEADEATIYFDARTREANKVIATGRVKAFKTDAEIKQRMKAECNEAVFHNQERKMVLRGNAKLWRGDDLVRGKQITYELDTGWIKADRVEGVVQPGGKK